MSMPTAVKVLTATTTISGLVGVYLFYDYKTCHPMRKVKYEPKEALVRLHNIGVNQLPVSWYLQMSLPELETYNGKGHNPTYFSAAGNVYDVSTSAMFQSTYSQWAGQDATVALAKMSLRQEDISRTDGWKSLSEQDRKSLDSWKLYLDEKYYIKARLKEWYAEDD
jgi:predicted heme/steroid binding protein